MIASVAFQTRTQLRLRDTVQLCCIAAKSQVLQMCVDRAPQMVSRYRHISAHGADNAVVEQHHARLGRVLSLARVRGRSRGATPVERLECFWGDPKLLGDRQPPLRGDTSLPPFLAGEFADVQRISSGVDSQPIEGVHDLDL